MTCLPVPVVPSPKFHEYKTIDPSASEDALASKDTSSGATPEAGTALNAAVGAEGVTTTVLAAVDPAPLLSWTVNWI